MNNTNAFRAVDKQQFIKNAYQCSMCILSAPRKIRDVCLRIVLKGDELISDMSDRQECSILKRKFLFVPVFCNIHPEE